ncbi:MAG: hypothetical protein AB7Q00_00345 [Phycisphaerales bacterium]
MSKILFIAFVVIFVLANAGIATWTIVAAARHPDPVVHAQSTTDPREIAAYARPASTLRWHAVLESDAGASRIRLVDADGTSIRSAMLWLESADDTFAFAAESEPGIYDVPTGVKPDRFVLRAYGIAATGTITTEAPR